MIPFQKLVGAGNDFIFVKKSELPEKLYLSQWSKKICDRHFGIGADGLAVISMLDASKYHFKWVFFNSDGSDAEMCGNAARCAVRYIKSEFQMASFDLETKAGLVHGEEEGPLAHVSWSLQNNQVEKIDIEISSGQKVSGFFINTGVPHFVLLNPDGNLFHQDYLEIQSHEQFGSDQTNITVLETGNGVNKTKSFERGVKNFTLACGTGVIASAFVLKQQVEQSQYDLQAPGGAISVRIDGHRVHLIGPAEKVYSGVLNEG